MKNLLALFLLSVAAVAAAGNPPHEYPRTLPVPDTLVSRQMFTPEPARTQDVPTPPAPGSQWSAAAFFAPHLQASAVVIYTFTTIQAIFGNPRLSVDVSVFAGSSGVTGASQIPVGGFMVGKSWAFAKNWKLIGGGAISTTGAKTVPGIVAGISGTF